MKKALVLGAGGFIGSHLVRRLKKEGFWVRGADLKLPDHWETTADDFVQDDLRIYSVCKEIIDQDFDEIYQLAADMGGAGYIFVGSNDADIMNNSAKINLNVLEACVRRNVKGRIFYSSSACIYPEHNQTDPNNPNCQESSAYPANPDSEYGWEKLFSERLFKAYRRNKGLNTFIGRYHNIFGPYGTWEGGREKAPAAICRKVALANDGDVIDVWGSGSQTRSFLYVDECIEGTLRVARSKYFEPLNIGSEEMVSINQLVGMVIGLSRKKLSINNVAGPVGVAGRNSDNRLIFEQLEWRPGSKLKDGLVKTYEWIQSEIKEKK